MDENNNKKMNLYMKISGFLFWIQELFLTWLVVYSWPAGPAHSLFMTRKHDWDLTSLSVEICIQVVKILKPQKFG